MCHREESFERKSVKKGQSLLVEKQNGDLANSLETSIQES